MSPFIAYLIAVALGLIVAVVMLEIAECREKERRDAESKAWRRARDVTGRIQ